MKFEVNISVKPYMISTCEYPRKFDAEFVASKETIEKIVEIIKKEIPEFKECPYD